MNKTENNSDDILKLAQEIQDFIEIKREPDEIVKAKVTEIEKNGNLLTLELEEYFNFYAGAMVTVNRFIGFVQDQFADSIKVLLNEKTEFKLDETVKIDSSLMNLVILRLQKTIDKILGQELDIKSKKNLQFILGKAQPHYNYRNIVLKSKKLNPSQKQAVERSLSAENFHLIIGPPGTGKTYVITEILNQLILSEEKTLITAWTNIAVDNMLEYFQEYPTEKILRIGSENKVDPINKKFTLKERRKESDDWDELQKLDKLIENDYQSVSYLNNKLKYVKMDLENLIHDRNHLNRAIKNINNTKNEFHKKSLKYKPLESKQKETLRDFEYQWDKLSKDSEEYFNLAQNLLNLEKMDENLPEASNFYELQREIEQGKSYGFINKITSPLRGKEYQKYQKELDDKNRKYEKIKQQYNHYWDERDKVEEEYIRFYGDDYGYPCQDSVEIELKLTKSLDKFFKVKRESFLQETAGSEQLIYESYQNYINSLEGKNDCLREEVAIFNNKINFKTSELNQIKEDIKYNQQLAEINKEKKKYLKSIIDNEILFKSKLIFVTVISSAHSILDEQEFEWMVMDEASQVASFMSLIPLLKTKKFILVGDDKQLQPIEESKLSAHLNLSIFNRLIEKFPKNSTFLDTQYRMNEEICNIASELFYEGKLKTVPEICNQTLDHEFADYTKEILNPDSPVTYIDTHDLEYFEDGVGSGCENSKEAGLVVQMVNMLVSEGISPENIGVITPYRRHKNNIESQLLETGKGNGVEVDTVYRFQGREKDVIILTFCNSKLGRLKPFLRNFIEKPSQVNVSLTRARKKLIMVGNSKNLKESKLLWKLIRLVGDENTVKISGEISNNRSYF